MLLLVLSCLVCNCCCLALCIVVEVLCVLLTSYVYLLYCVYIVSFFFNLDADCWLEVSTQKILRPFTSTQVFLGFAVPISKC